jgi:lysophospholipase L1-like esterase
VVAYGDSITFGVGAVQPYPDKLRLQLQTIYTKGPVSVANYGTPGELASEGVSGLASALATSPRVVLIMEGVNDLNAKVNNPNDPNDLPTAVAALDSMVHESEQAGAVVALATLPPERPGWDLLTGRRARSPDLIDALNAEIRQIAAADSALLADVSAAFGGDLSLISGDGLHPTQAGYDRIAQTFFDALKPVVSGL